MQTTWYWPEGSSGRRLSSSEPVLRAVSVHRPRALRSPLIVFRRLGGRKEMLMLALRSGAGTTRRQSAPMR